jgi:8-oxo-dGTP pyrophosphatase MutT (NUDIX family)
MTSEPTSATKTGIEYTVVIATRERDGRKQFLMAHHSERGWELPGGKLEANEGPVHCALREFREETGHLLSEPRFVLKMQKENGTCYVFTGGLGSRVDDQPKDAVIRGVEWHDHLPDADLAFPDDPYDEMGEALGIRFQRP